MSEISAITDAPYTFNDVQYPILSLRSIGKLISLYRASEEKKVRETFEKEKLTVDQKARFLAMTAIPDPSIEHIYDWVFSAAGSVEAVRQSLIQSGNSVIDAEKIIDTFKKMEDVRTVAMEVIDHPLTSKNVKVRQEAEEKSKGVKEDPKA